MRASSPCVGDERRSWRSRAAPRPAPSPSQSAPPRSTKRSCSSSPRGVAHGQRAVQQREAPRLAPRHAARRERVDRMSRAPSATSTSKRLAERRAGGRDRVVRAPTPAIAPGPSRRRTVCTAGSPAVAVDPRGRRRGQTRVRALADRDVDRAAGRRRARRRSGFSSETTAAGSSSATGASTCSGSVERQPVSTVAPPRRSKASRSAPSRPTRAAAGAHAGDQQQLGAEPARRSSSTPSPVLRFVNTNGRSPRMPAGVALHHPRSAPTYGARSILLMTSRSERMMPGPPLRGIFSPSATSIT